MNGSAKRGGVPCGGKGCKTKIKPFDKKLTCECCNTNYHLVCSEFNPEAFEILLVQDSLNNIIWCCPPCRAKVRNNIMFSDDPTAQKALDPESIKSIIQNELKSISETFDAKIELLKTTFLSKLETVQSSTSEYADVLMQNINKQSETEELTKNEFGNLKSIVTDNINNLISEIGSNKSNVNENFKSYVDVISANLVQKNNETTEVISEISKDFKNLQTNIELKLDKEKEINIREKKKFNLCIFNLPESDSSDKETQHKHDIAALKTIFLNKVEILPKDIGDIFRIGERLPNKVRTIIMRFTTLEKRSEILRLRSLVFETETSEKINIYVSPDRTKAQQETHRN